MWQKLVLTAGTEAQNLIFREQLSLIPTDEYCETIEVVTDESPRIRIGSGGATLSIIRRILQQKDGDRGKILLIHSGGLSQRMPHLSAYGKAFGMLPNGKTLLETKLEIYKRYLFEKLPSTGGIMISASDVLENMEEFSKSSDVSDVLVFSHPSSLEVGTQHGVFVMCEQNELKKVLQKPSKEEMIREEAVRTDGSVLTDSCYFMTWKFCERLLEHKLLREPVTEELCCYGDFMRPMGTDPKLDYIQKCASPKLAAYRKVLADVFKTADVQITVLGLNSFFHFGTYSEFLEHLDPKSDFRKSFPLLFESNVIRSSGFQNVSMTSFVEFSTGELVEIGSGSFVSGVDAENLKVTIPDETVVFTMSLKSKEYVTVIVNIDEDIKEKSERVTWNGHDTGIRGKTMWEAPIFGVYETRAKSLEGTLREWKNGISDKVVKRVSISGAVVEHELGADLERRRQLIHLKTGNDIVIE